jgi:hypothetical protein
MACIVFELLTGDLLFEPKDGDVLFLYFANSVALFPPWTCISDAAISERLLRASRRATTTSRRSSSYWATFRKYLLPYFSCVQIYISLYFFMS